MYLKLSMMIKCSFKVVNFHRQKSLLYWAVIYDFDLSIISSTSPSDIEKQVVLILLIFLLKKDIPYYLEVLL